ncbi:hypothetical protein GJAV_G00151160 [Gymnothorax javanicus]|nr:hypothetical protein GJAV_G00151160 [Gymnothorax javanicus]
MGNLLPGLGPLKKWAARVSHFADRKRWLSYLEVVRQRRSASSELKDGDRLHTGALDGRGPSEEDDGV